MAQQTLEGVLREVVAELVQLGQHQRLGQAQGPPAGGAFDEQRPPDLVDAGNSGNKDLGVAVRYGDETSVGQENDGNREGRRRCSKSRRG